MTEARQAGSGKPLRSARRGGIRTGARAWLGRMRTRHPSLANAAFTVAALAAATTLSAAASAITAIAPFMFFHGATFAAAWFGGLWPGLFAAAAGGLLGNLLFLLPHGGMSTSAPELAATLVFLGAGIFVSLLFESRARAVRLAEEAIGIRDEFVSVAGHELRTPLTTLRLRLQYLRRRPELAAEDVDIALRQLARIGALVDDLLDVGRLELGPVRLECEEVDLSQLARSVAETVADDAALSDTPIRVDAAQSVRGIWDPAQLERAFTNLLVNALKYGRGQPVDVRVESDGDRAVFSVRDRGIGIPPGDQRRIFDRFERAVPSRSYGGLGLGLWIAREIVRAHEGEIRLESAPETGSTFTVELPLRPAQGRVAARRGMD